MSLGRNSRDLEKASFSGKPSGNQENTGVDVDTKYLGTEFINFFFLIFVKIAFFLFFFFQEYSALVVRTVVFFF